MDLSVVIPIYNSEKTLTAVMTGLMKELAPRSFEIVLVNDASRDGSDMVCRELAQAHPNRVQYIHLKKNVGEYNAVRIGMKSARGEFVLIMDDDGQHPPSEANKLWDEIRSGDHDVVYGQFSRLYHSLTRRALSYLNDKMAVFLWKKPPGLYLSSFKIMKRSLAKRIADSTPDTPYFEPFILGATRRIGRVAVEHRPRTAGHSGYTYGKLFALSFNAYKPALVKRMKFFGVILALHAMILAIWAYFLPHESLDMRKYFWPWYDTFAYKGGWQALSHAFSDYAPLYTYLLFAMTFTKPFISTVTAIKLIPIAFNFFAAYLMYRIAGLAHDSVKIKWTAYFAVLFAPTVILNGACWGQVDIIYGSFLLATVLALAENRANAAIIYFSIAFAFKLQSVFLLPFLAALVLKGHIHWKYFLWIPAIYAACALPCAIMGRSWASLFGVYFGQMAQYPRLSTGAPNLYSFAGWKTDETSFYMALALGALTVCIFVGKSLKVKTVDKYFLLVGATLSVALMPSVLPRMHGRYLFAADLLSIGLAFYRPRLWIVPVIFQFTSGLAHVRTLWQFEPIPMGWLGVINLVPLLILGTVYYRLLQKKI